MKSVSKISESLTANVHPSTAMQQFVSCVSYFKKKWKCENKLTNRYAENDVDDIKPRGRPKITQKKLSDK